MLAVGCSTESLTKESSQGSGNGPIRAKKVLTGDNNLEVHFIDVGQADAIYVGLGDFDMIIDGGNNDDGDLVVDYLKDKVDGSIELMVGTHMHEDHIGGLDTVLKNYDVDKIIDSGSEKDTKTYRDYAKAVKAEPAKYLKDKDMTINVGGGLTVEILEAGDNFKDTNDNSVIVKLTYGERSFLFTGDAEKEIEHKLVKRDIDVDVFKAGHHGSSSSNTKEFLNKVTPSIVIISAGKDNKYGHPHKEAVTNFSKHTDQVYGTWEEGHIVVITDGSGIDVHGAELLATEGNIDSAGEDVNASAEGVEKNNTESENVSQENQNIESVESNAVAIEITSVDRAKETVDIKNNGNEAVDLKGYKIRSVKGDQWFEFLSYNLEPGETVIVYAKGGTGDIKWADKNIWNNDGDPAELYDSHGELISEY